MLITTYFSNGGIPATGLTPSIRIRNADTTSIVVADEAMSEIGDGFYKYNFSGYNESINYTIRADGGSGLSSSDRYIASSNEIGAIKTDTEKTLKIERNKWVIENFKLKYYDDDGTTILQEFDLEDENGNPTVSNVMRRIPL